MLKGLPTPLQENTPYMMSLQGMKSDSLQLNLVGQKAKLRLQLIVTHPLPFPQGHEETLPEMGEIFM